MLPKEHGAWPQLLLPMLTALIAWPSVASAMVASAAIAVFVTHEPALILLGTRGQGALERERARATRWLLVAGSCATVAALAALVTTTSGARLALAAAPSITLAATLGWMARGHRERTDLGECVAAAALSSVSVATAVAGGAVAGEALSMWLVWSVGFIAITGAVRAALAGPKKRDPRPSRRVAVLATVAAAALAPFTAGATLVSALCAGALLIAPPAAKDIRRAGWALASGSVATALWLLAAR
jgi:hypothetical protein